MRERCGASGGRDCRGGDEFEERSENAQLTVWDRSQAWLLHLSRSVEQLFWYALRPLCAAASQQHCVSGRCSVRRTVRAKPADERHLMGVNGVCAGAWDGGGERLLSNFR